MKIEMTYPYDRKFPFDVPRSAWLLDTSFPEDDERAVRPIKIIGFYVAKKNNEKVCAPTFLGVGWDIGSEPLGGENSKIEFYDSKREAKTAYKTVKESTKGMTDDGVDYSDIESCLSDVEG